ncbi:Ubiquitin-like modifier-activating enzyme atg7 [Glycine soja]|nr:hypothetical protein JHK86_026044 [Glycine max]KHN11707.1 hypothetical protein glysoja_006160 [Glycine soja]
MTQKANLFKGKAKKKSIPPNRHGKVPVTRKGKRFVKPSKVTKDMDTDREVSKFINHCNEIKAATLATKDGGQLGIIKPPQEPASFYAPCSQSHLTVLAESLPSVPGILYNTNTVDKNDLLKTETILDSCSA